MNFLEVPVVSDEQNSLRLQLHLSMKVLFRPEGLQGKASDAPGKLRWTWRDAGNGSMRVLAENPTPYSVTFRTLKVRSQGMAWRADRPAPVVRVLRGTLARAA